MAEFPLKGFTINGDTYKIAAGGGSKTVMANWDNYYSNDGWYRDIILTEDSLNDLHIGDTIYINPIASTYKSRIGQGNGCSVGDSHGSAKKLLALNVDIRLAAIVPQMLVVVAMNNASITCAWIPTTGKWPGAINAQDYNPDQMAGIFLNYLGAGKIGTPTYDFTLRSADQDYIYSSYTRAVYSPEGITQYVCSSFDDLTSAKYVESDGQSQLNSITKKSSSSAYVMDGSMLAHWEYVADFEKHLYVLEPGAFVDSGTIVFCVNNGNY